MNRLILDNFFNEVDPEELSFLNGPDATLIIKNVLIQGLIEGEPILDTSKKVDGYIKKSLPYKFLGKVTPTFAQNILSKTPGLKQANEYVNTPYEVNEQLTPRNKKEKQIDNNYDIFLSDPLDKAITGQDFMRGLFEEEDPCGQIEKMLFEQTTYLEEIIKENENVYDNIEKNKNVLSELVRVTTLQKYKLDEIRDIEESEIVRF